MDKDDIYCNCSSPENCNICDSGLCHNCGGILKRNRHRKKRREFYWDKTDEEKEFDGKN